MAKVYDYEAIVRALMLAQEDWSSQGRVTRKTYTRLRKLMSQRVVDKMTHQLLSYQNPMSTMGAVATVLDLPQWRKALAWARRGLPSVVTLGGPYVEPPSSRDIGLSEIMGRTTPEQAEANLRARGLDVEQYRVETRAHARMRAAGL